MNEKGIYRLSGSHSSVQRLKVFYSVFWRIYFAIYCIFLKATLNANPSSVIAETEEVHDVTGVLKLYFREMPEPLVPFVMYTFFHIAFTEYGIWFPFIRYDSFIAAVQIEDDSKLPTLRQLLSFLPADNKAIFIALIAHLYKVAQASNLMDDKNLGTFSLLDVILSLTLFPLSLT